MTCRQTHAHRRSPARIRSMRSSLRIRVAVRFFDQRLDGPSEMGGRIHALMSGRILE